MRSLACTIAQSRCLHINRSLGPKYLRLCSITHVALARRRACQAIGHHVEAPRVVDPQCVHCRGHERPPPRRVQHRAVQVVLERPRCLRAPTLCRAAGRGLHGRPGLLGFTTGAGRCNGAALASRRDGWNHMVGALVQDVSRGLSLLTAG
jgi:hypothetical protein